MEHEYLTKLTLFEQLSSSYQKPSDVLKEMPRPLDSSMSTNQYCGTSKWTFWSSRPNDELNYQCMKMGECDHPDAAPVVPSYTGIYGDMIKSIFEGNYFNRFCLIQFWAPVKVNGLTFLSTADQPFALTGKLDKWLCLYRKLCLDTLMIPIDICDTEDESLLGPPGRVFIRGFPEYSSNIQSYSTVEFPLLQHAIQLGIQSYYAIPVFKLHENHCLGVFEFASTNKYFCLSDSWKDLHLGSSGLYIPCKPSDILSKLSEPWKLALDQIKAGLGVVQERHSLPFAQIWIPDSESSSIKALIATQGSKYYSLSYQSGFCYIQRGKAVVGRAFSSQGSCFCKDVTLLSLTEYPLVHSARKDMMTLCFAICLRSKCANNFIYVVECFLRPNKMVNRDPQTFLNMLLSTMKEQLPDVTVASGQELGQRMVVEVVKVSASDELDSFEIGQPLPSVQSLLNGGETTEIDSLNQQSNLQNVENNVTAEQLVPCSSHRPDSFNCERSVQVDTPTLVPRPTEEAVTVNVDVAHDDHIEFEIDRGEMIQPDSHFEQPNVEFDITGNARSNDKVAHNNIARCLPVVEAEVINKDSNIISGAAPSTQRTDSQISSKLPRKDYGITREKLKEQFGKTLIDAAKNLSVSRSTLKRICREYDISRWPHHKTRKVNHHASKGVALQGAEPYVEDQERPNLSREKGTDRLAHKRFPAAGKVCDSVMTLKVEYGDDIIKFKLTPESTREDLEAEVEKRLKISLLKFTIKYQDEDNEWITITADSDLRDGMDELRSLKRTTMRCKIVG